MVGAPRDSRSMETAHFFGAAIHEQSLREDNQTKIFEQIQPETPQQIVPGASSEDILEEAAVDRNQILSVSSIVAEAQPAHRTPGRVGEAGSVVELQNQNSASGRILRPGFGPSQSNKGVAVEDDSDHSDNDVYDAGETEGQEANTVMPTPQ